MVVLAGDIHLKHHGINWVKEHFDVPVIYVPGNHEYFGCEILSNNKKMKSLAKNSNVHVLINDSVEIDGVLFVGATLWTDFFFMEKITWLDVAMMLKIIWVTFLESGLKKTNPCWYSVILQGIIIFYRQFIN